MVSRSASVNICDNPDRWELFHRFGSSSTSYLTLSDGLREFRGSREGYVAYSERFRVALVPGDPTVDPDDLKGSARELRDHFSGNGGQVCLFSCNEATKEAFEAQGFSCLYIGSEPVVLMDEFSLTGRRKRGLRGSVNRARRLGLTVETYRPDRDRDPEVESGIRSVSTEWGRTKGTPELGFLVGRLNFEETLDKRYYLCRGREGLESFILLYPIPSNGDFYLDHMRRRPDAPNGSMDFLICSAIEELREGGAKRLYLGLCPFSRMSWEGNGNPSYVTSLFRLLPRPFGLLYPASSELVFKRKYANAWEPRFMCCYPRVSFRALLAILDAFCPGGLAAILSHRAKRLIRGRSGTARGRS